MSEKRRKPYIMAQVRVDPQVWYDFKEVCENQGITLTEGIDSLIRGYLNEVPANV